MIDSHCHLADSAFDTDRTDVITRAKEANVFPFIIIADSLEESQKVLSIAQQYEVFATAGVHPHNASTWKRGDSEELQELAMQERIVAIGEIGLDYHYDHSPRNVQQSAFEAQLALAHQLHLPAVLHSREAIEDTWAIIENIKPQKLVLHCCTERFEDIERFLAKGYLLSFTGIASYPNAQIIHQTIKHTPIEQMMIETDAPYLSPIPHRGKRNEPAWVIEVARCIADIKNLPLEEVDRVTTENAQSFFALPQKPPVQ